MRTYLVNCIQVTGHGKLVFKKGDEVTDAQVDNVEALVEAGFLVEKSVEKRAEKSEKLTESRPKK